jgi:hypothetical protein
MTEETTLPTVTDAGRRLSTVARLAEIPEEEIWLSKQKSARTRRAYWLDVRHFMRTLSISSPGELRQADHKAGDRLGALYARGRAGRLVDDPPPTRGAILAL